MNLRQGESLLILSTLIFGVAPNPDNSLDLHRKALKDYSSEVVEKLSYLKHAYDFAISASQGHTIFNSEFAQVCNNANELLTIVLTRFQYDCPMPTAGRMDQLVDVLKEFRNYETRTLRALKESRRVLGIRELTKHRSVIRQMKEEITEQFLHWSGNDSQVIIKYLKDLNSRTQDDVFRQIRESFSPHNQPTRGPTCLLTSYLSVNNQSRSSLQAAFARLTDNAMQLKEYGVACAYAEFGNSTRLGKEAVEKLQYRISSVTMHASEWIKQFFVLSWPRLFSEQAKQALIGTDDITVEDYQGTAVTARKVFESMGEQGKEYQVVVSEPGPLLGFWCMAALQKYYYDTHTIQNFRGVHIYVARFDRGDRERAVKSTAWFEQQKERLEESLMNWEPPRQHVFQHQHVERPFGRPLPQRPSSKKDEISGGSSSNANGLRLADDR